MTTATADTIIRPSMRQQVTRVFGVIILLIAVASGFVVYWMETDHLEQEKRSQYDQLLALLRSSARDAIVAEDVNLLSSLLDQVGRNDQNIVRIEITNDEQTTIAELTRETTDVDSTNLISLNSPVMAGGAKQGEIQLDINLQSVQEQIKRHVRLFVALLFLMLLGLLLILLWLVNRTTLKPILAVEERLDELGEGTFPADFEEGGSREIAHLARSLHQQSARLRSENLQRISAQETVEQKNNELQSALAKLRDAQGALVKKERIQALGEMAGGMAHDFNNSLTPILAASDLLKEFRTLEESLVDEFVDMIRTAARDAAELIRGIRRNFTQAPSDSIQTIRLDTVVSSAVQFAKSELALGKRRHKAANISIDHDVDPNLQIWGSETLLRQATVNLILNAVDAIPDGGSVRVAGDRDGDRVVLTVTDQGIGMSPDVIEKCTSPGFTTKGDLGVGLGLTNVVTVANEFGGTIEIDSTLDVGTTVRVLLPSVESLVSTDETTQRVVLNVLVVDDEPAVRRGVVRLLERLGHRATAVETPFAAIDMIREQEPDLLLTDFTMPEMNGGELAMKVAELAPNLAVILMTAFRDAVASFPGAEDLFQVIIDKPVGLDSLTHAIASMKNSSSRQQEEDSNIGDQAS
ncbi:MAG: response regulator [Fuerstiella sp.]|nr:response regulator [Fuerstiella sp.]